MRPSIGTTITGARTGYIIEITDPNYTCFWSEELNKVLSLEYAKIYSDPLQAMLQCMQFASQHDKVSGHWTSRCKFAVLKVDVAYSAKVTAIEYDTHAKGQPYPN